ncbi:ATP-binding protein [Pelosinus sp. sgz500959]|uniref:ATP-binding protein n=1 Tax=Pelosinus sp. sgz500959 TaxID=3242472 RepID=UPI0036703784
MLFTASVFLLRVRASLLYPIKFMVVTSRNLCPCGLYGDPSRECICLSYCRTMRTTQYFFLHSLTRYAERYHL